MRVHRHPADDLLTYVNALARAVARRDRVRASWLLGDPLAVHLPREVIEEALVLSRSTTADLRAPIHLLRYWHRTVQLLRPAARGLPDESQLAFELGDRLEPAGTH